MREREWVRETEKWKKYNKRIGKLVGRDTFYQKFLDLLVRKLNHIFAINLSSQHYILFLVIHTQQLLFQWALYVSIISPSICHEVMEQDAMILVFWMLSLKPTFSLLSFTLIKKPFSSSSLSSINVVSSSYLRLLVFLLAILIPVCASFSPALLMMYSAYRLNKQGENMQPWHTPFPIWNQSVVPCPVLTVASLPAYRFLRRKVKWSGIPISLRIFHSLLWST